MIPAKKQSFTRVLEIAMKMRKQKLSEEFVESVVRLAMDLEGIRDLMVLWAEETEAKERGEIIADLQEEIEIYQNAPKTIAEKPTVQFEQLEALGYIKIFLRKVIYPAAQRQSF